MSPLAKIPDLAPGSRERVHNGDLGVLVAFSIRLKWLTKMFTRHRTAAHRQERER